MNGFPLDTNILSELIKPKPERKVLQWIAGLRAGPRRTKLESWLETGLRSRFSGRILPIDEGVADRWGTLTAVAATGALVVNPWG